jgi:hypothetical protein
MYKEIFSYINMKLINEIETGLENITRRRLPRSYCNIQFLYKNID